MSLRKICQLADKFEKLAQANSIIIDLGKTEQIITSEGRTLSNYRSPDDLRPIEEYIQEFRTHYLGLVTQAMETIKNFVQSAISRIPNWSPCIVQIRPMISESRDIYDNPLYTSEGYDKTFLEADVSLLSGTGDAPGFSLFMGDGQPSVDDVLDAGDRDFFTDPEIEANYFALVNEIRNPGQNAKDQDRIVGLYTARPKSDRQLYEHATTIPNNIFLTTSLDEAEGYMMDMGERDIWYVKIKKKFLVETLNAGGRRNYQAFSPGGQVPIESISLV